MTATLRDVTATLPPPPVTIPERGAQAATRRHVQLIAAASAIILALIVTYAVGRNRGYNEGRDAGQVEALRKCGKGWDAGIVGNLASLTAPRGTRTVVCAVPEQLLDD